MTKLEMVKIALKDFKKFGESKKCRFYKNIIAGLRTIPCGTRDPNKFSEFYQFLPANMRKGIKREKVVEIVFQFYVGYSDAMSDKELKEFLKKRYAKIYYQKNRQKMLDNAKRSHFNNQAKRIKYMRERYHADPQYHITRYKHKAEEYRIKNRDTRNIYFQFNRLSLKKDVTKKD